MPDRLPKRTLETVLAGLPDGVTIDRYEKHAHTLELFVSWKEPALTERVCPKCGSTHCVKKDCGSTQTIRHVRTGIYGTLLTFHKPRFLCRECGAAFYARPPFAVPGMSVSVAVFLEIVALLTSTTHSLSDIAGATNTSPSIVLHAMYRISLDKPKSLPETIGIDEFHGKTGSYNRARKRFDTEKYHCVITDAEQGSVIDVLYKATYRQLHSYFMEYPLFRRQNVRFFCTDMRSGFSKVARSCFPNAKICIDPFHVIKLITEAVNDVRIDEWHRLKAEAGSLLAQAGEADAAGEAAVAEKLRADAGLLKEHAEILRSSRRLLVTSPFNEDAYWNRHEKLRDEKYAAVCTIAPSIKTARDALVGFYELVELVTDKYRHAELTKWISRYKDCDLPPIRQAASSISARRKGIENAWRYGKSNGPTEGLNKKIKDVRRMGFGAHDFENFRRRILLACGSTTIETVRYTVFGEKASEAPRKEVMPLYG